MLPSLVRTLPSTEDTSPEDLFTWSLGLIFTDDSQNRHGTLDSSVQLGYTSRHLGTELKLRVSVPANVEEEGKFAHCLWNAEVLMAELVGGKPAEEKLREHEEYYGRKLAQEDNNEGDEKRWWIDEAEGGHWAVRGKSVIELGAGVGLAGIVSALVGATDVTFSDYPSPDIIETIKANVQANIPDLENIHIEGHQWGAFDTDFAKQSKGRFERLLAADCLWMPHQHENLARSIAYFLDPTKDSKALVIAGFHTGRTKLAPFFEEVIQRAGLEVEDIFEMDAEGRRRPWVARRDGEREEPGSELERKWLALARLRLKSSTAAPTAGNAIP